MRASGLTSAADWEGSPGRGCVTGAPELQLRTLDLRTRRSIRDTGRVAMEPVGLAKTCLSSRLQEHSNPGLSLPWVSPARAGGGGASAANRRWFRAMQPIGEGPVPRGLLGVVVQIVCFLFKQGNSFK